MMPMFHGYHTTKKPSTGASLRGDSGSFPGRRVVLGEARHRGTSWDIVGRPNTINQWIWGIVCAFSDKPKW